jgi:hypothetical protein
MIEGIGSGITGKRFAQQFFGKRRPRRQLPGMRHSLRGDPTQQDLWVRQRIVRKQRDSHFVRLDWHGRVSAGSTETNKHKANGIKVEGSETLEETGSPVTSKP